MVERPKNKGNDSVIDEVTSYLYDANDRLIDELFAGQNDGSFEKVTHYGYDQTQQISKTVSENGIITSDTTFEYNALGQMSVVKITEYTDGVVSSIEKTTLGYGSGAIRISALHEIDSNADGIYDKVTLTEYLNDLNNYTGYSQVLKTIEYSIDDEGIKTGTKEIYYTIGLDQNTQGVTNYVDGVAQETEKYFFAYDGHGSTRILLDPSSMIVQLYSYDAHGNAMDFNSNNALTEYLYSGEQFDSKIDQQYLRARYYDPTTGRFNSLDSFFGDCRDPQSLHKYLYAHADPITKSDPSGLSVYFAVRIINGLPFGVQRIATWLNAGYHGFIYIDDGTWAHNVIATYSWHPDHWIPGYETLLWGEKSYPGRIWKNDPRDQKWSYNNLNGGHYFKLYHITSDNEKQCKLMYYIENTWFNENNVGWEEGPEYYGKYTQYLEHGCYYSVSPASNATEYSLLNHNCFWWAYSMLKNTNIDIPSSVYTEIAKYNFGVGIEGDGYSLYRNTSAIAACIAGRLGYLTITYSVQIAMNVAAAMTVSCMIGF